MIWETFVRIMSVMGLIIVIIMIIVWMVSHQKSAGSITPGVLSLAGVLTFVTRTQVIYGLGVQGGHR